MKIKRTIIKPLSLCISAALLFASVCSNAIALGKETGIEDFTVISPVINAPSEYGYITPQWEDSQGNIVDFDALANPEPRKRFSLFSRSAPAEVTILPSAFDARNAGYVSGAKYQSDANVCWAFTAMGALEAYDVSHGVSAVADTDYSESHLVWFTQKSLTPDVTDATYGDGFNSDAPFSHGGNKYYTMGTLARWSGIADEYNFPFDPDNYATQCCYNEELRYANNGRRLRDAIELNVDQVKQAVYDNGAVEVSVCYEDSAEYYAANGDCTYYSPSTDATNHALLICGWDDNYPVSNFNPASRPTNPGAWLIRNSWSEYWGDNGFAWVSYETGSLSDFTVYTTMSASLHDNNYQYDGFGISGNPLFGASDTRVANVFTAKGNELLKSIGFYVCTENTACTVKIYKNIISSYSSPIQGTLAYTSSELNFPNLGYFTVDLSNPVELEADEIFSVVISYNGYAYFPVEPSPTSGELSFASYAGESYYTIGDGRAWTDFVASGTAGNLHIKAFTKDIKEELVPNTTLDEFMDMLSVGMREFFVKIFAYMFRIPD